MRDKNRARSCPSFSRFDRMRGGRGLFRWALLLILLRGATLIVSKGRVTWTDAIVLLIGVLVMIVGYVRARR
jgi:hypothetical protein